MSKSMDEQYESIHSGLSKRELVENELNNNITNGTTIQMNIMREHGVMVSMPYIGEVRRTFDLKRRHPSIKTAQPVKPFATSGVTRQPVVHDYLKTRPATSPAFLKVGVYDIETTGLFADFGYVLSIAIKDIDTGEIKSFRLDETDWYKRKECWGDPNYWDAIDVELLDKFSQEYNQYNILITYNGKMFDNKFLDTRILRLGLPTLNRAVNHLDMVWVARKVLKTRSKKMDAVKNFLNIDDEKDSHEWAQWRMAAAGVKEGFDFVEQHNIKDVEQLHEIVSKMKDHIKYIIF